MLITNIPRENRDRMIRDIQSYVYDELDIEVGTLAAENILSFFSKEMGPYIYNQAIKDARKLVGERMLSLEEDLFALESPLKKK